MSLELRFCTSRKGGQGKVGDCDTKQLTSISSFTTLIIVQLNVWPYTYPWGQCVLVGCTKTYWVTIIEASHYSSNFDLITHQLIALVLFSNNVKTKLYPHLQEMPDCQITWLTQIRQNSRQKKNENYSNCLLNVLLFSETLTTACITCQLSICINL